MADNTLLTPEVAASPDLAKEYMERNPVGLALPNIGGPAIATPPTSFVGFNPQTNEMFVNGMRFDADDHRTALQSRDALRSEETYETPDGFVPLGPDDYKGYLRTIEDPSFAQLFKKNFGVGVDATQMLLYGAAQAAGRGTGFEALENFGAEGVKRNVEELSYNEPYQRRFTDIESAGDAGEWFVANLGQLAPSIVETIAAAGIGALVGTATGGPGLGTIGGFALGLGSKQAAKKALKEQITGAIAKKRAGEELQPDEAALLRRVGAAGGGLVGSAINSYALGVGDIFTEGEAEGEGDVAKAFGLAPFYAASEFIPQLAGLSAVARGFRQGIRQGRRSTRAAAGLGLGVAAEGSTEAFQEALVMGATGQLDFSNPEVTDRLIDAFAAGAGVGGPLGFIGGALVRNQGKGPTVNINDVDTPVDVVQNEPVDPTGPAQGELFPGADLGVQPGQQELFPDADLGQAPDTPSGGLQYDLFNTNPPVPQDVSGEQLGLDLFPTPAQRAREMIDARQAQQEFAATPAGQARAMVQGFQQATLPQPAQTSEGISEAFEPTNESTVLAEAFRRAQAQQQAEQVPAPTSPAAPVPGTQRTPITPQDVAAMGQQREVALAEEQQLAQQQAAQDVAYAQAEAQRARQEAAARQQQLGLPGLGVPYAQRQRDARRTQPDQRAPEDTAGRKTPGQGELFIRRGGKRTAPQPTAQAQQQPVQAEAEDVAAQRAEEKKTNALKRKMRAERKEKVKDDKTLDPDLQVSYTVAVPNSDQTFEMKGPAATALRNAERNIEAFTDLIKCLRK